MVSSALAPGGLTVAGLLATILVLGSRGVWYYASTVRGLTKDRDDWKAIATAATDTVATQGKQIADLTGVVEKVATGRRLQ